MHKDNFIELHFLKSLLPGYLWIFPLPNGEANVGLDMLELCRKEKESQPQAAVAKHHTGRSRS